MHRALWTVVLVLFACGLSSVDSYDVVGVVEAIDARELQIKIAHEDIPGLMPAMTMSFDVASPELLEGVLPGSRVRFRLERSATTLRILSLQVIGLPDPDRIGDVSGGPGVLLELAPDFRLVDHDGRERSSGELRGRAVLLDFIFTSCPGPCPMLTAAHAALQREIPPELAERTLFVSISLDPARDTPEKLREYAIERGADLSRWWFLTGDPENVSEVLQAYQIGSIRRPDGNIDHIVATYLIAPDGRIAQRYVGLEHERAEILADLAELLL